MKTDNKLSVWLIAILLAGLLAIRVFLSLTPSFDIDMGTWKAWSMMLVDRGPAGFYSAQVWTHYLPGYLYVLWALGLLSRLFGTENLPFLIKFSSTLIDLGTAWLIYALVKKVSFRWAILCAGIYALNPALIFNTNVWGQVDGVLALFLLLTVASLTEWQRPILSTLFLAVSFLVKPQAIAILPAWLFLMVRKNSPKQVFMHIGLLILTLLIIGFPFFLRDPLFGLGRLFWQMANDYPYTSLFAFNFWYIVGSWKADNLQFFGLSFATWGVILYILSLIPIFWFLIKKKVSAYFVSALLMLVFFIFPTRVHERYLFPFFAFLLVTAGLTRSLSLLVMVVLYSLVHLGNLYYVYIYYTKNWLNQESLKSLIEQVSPLLSVLSVGGFFAILKFHLLEAPIRKVVGFIGQRGLLFGSLGVNFPEIDWVKKRWRKFLLFIFLFAFASRFIRLDIPKTYMFDEVYHAFTAREMLKGNKAAWEWWNTPPQGFAYEWSHPPLAKELMAVALSLINSPLGWRVPGAFLGAVSVVLVFAIAWEVFKNRSIAVLSAALFSLDTLPLVMSRIGMNDSYFLFFSLLAVWFLLRERFLLMGLAWGLAVASKWSAIYFIGLVLFVWLSSSWWKSARKTMVLTVGCLVVAPLIYLFSYLPFFSWGHTPVQFNELQHQMWWYHTGLKATHPYQSQWWSWPLTLRPVWIAVDYQKDTIANVYAQGNPILYWVGVVAIVVALVIATRDRRRALGVTIAGYGMFFLPWAFSPRIMFIYHYLPSTPFLVMLVAWFLVWLWQQGKRRLASGLFFSIVLAFLFFYPHVTSFAVPNEIDKLFYWLPSWK